MVVAVACAVLGVVGEGSGCLAGDKGEQQKEEEDGDDRKQEAPTGSRLVGINRGAPGHFAVFTEVEVEIMQSRCKRVRFHFVRWLGVGLDD